MSEIDEVIEVDPMDERAAIRTALIQIQRAIAFASTYACQMSERLAQLEMAEISRFCKDPTPEQQAEIEQARRELLQAAEVPTSIPLDKLFPPMFGVVDRMPVKHVHPIGPSPGQTAAGLGANEIDNHDHEFPGSGWHARGQDPTRCVYCGRSFKELQSRYGGPQVMGKPKTVAAVKKLLGIKEERVAPAPAEPAAPAKPMVGWDAIAAKTGAAEGNDEEACEEALRDAEATSPGSVFVQTMREHFDKNGSFSKGQLQALRNIANSRRKRW